MFKYRAVVDYEYRIILRGHREDPSVGKLETVQETARIQVSALDEDTAKTLIRDAFSGFRSMSIKQLCIVY